MKSAQGVQKTWKMGVQGGAMTKTEGLLDLPHNSLYFAYQRDGSRMDKSVCDKENTNNEELFFSQTRYTLLTLKGCSESQLTGNA